MPARLSRRAFGVTALALLAAERRAHAADPGEIRIDWATYNPVSIVLKEQGLLEQEFAKDRIGVRWVQSLGSNKALEFLNAGSIDFGSTAGAAALIGKINGNPIRSVYVYSRPEWTALVTMKDSPIHAVADLKGQRIAVTRGTDPHIFLVRALATAGLTEHDVKLVLLQHPDGRTALERGDVAAWAGLDPMMAAAEVESGARLFYRNAGANTWGVLNVREAFAAENPDLVRRVLVTLRARAPVVGGASDGTEGADDGSDEAAGCGGRAPARAQRPDQRRDRREAGADHHRGREGVAASRRAAGRCRCSGGDRQAASIRRSRAPRRMSAVSPAIEAPIARPSREARLRGSAHRADHPGEPWHRLGSSRSVPASPRAA